MNSITFNTLAYPNRQIERVIRKATEYGYQGIDWATLPVRRGRCAMNQAFEILLTNDKVRLVWNGSMPAALRTVQKVIPAAQRETV